MVQPHRGEREFLGVRVPTEVGDAVRDEVIAGGWRSLSDYVASVLAERHGLPFHARKVAGHEQEALPLQSAS